MSNRFIKVSINRVRFPQFQLAYIYNTTQPSHKYLVKLCHDVHYMWWDYQELELQKSEYCIKSNNTIILDIITLVPKNNPLGYI